MKFVTYYYNGKESVGMLAEGGIIELPEFNSMIDLIKNFNEDKISKDNSKVLPLSSVKLLAPIPHPERNILCLGKNYVDHAKELVLTKVSDNSIPDAPIYFTKATASVIANEEYITFSTEATNQADYEVELAIVIGKGGINIKPEQAEDYIFGYTIVNDVSARDLQVKHNQWFKAKSLDTFCPMGPSIVHKSEISFPVELNIKSIVNGEVRQNSNTKNLIFDIPYIISDLSKGLTLKPGDIICTGTPSGVGAAMNPPRFLQHGDVVECEIENLGKLVNTVKVI